LTLAINSDFLNAQVKISDVIIDPLVQSMGTLHKNMILGSHSNQDCSLDTACEYDFMVPAPPGATLINAMFSFGFTANAPCVGTDGAFSFAINGGCLSQQYQGTASGTGQQKFPNQNILLNNGGSLAGCFPSPVCSPLPQNIPFSFYFYRKCHGPEGCDGSCIAASQDLTITLVGRTFDSASLSASPQNSCAGTPVTLTARGYYGIPPYNFVWQGLSQYNGDSVIQVNPTTNTTYTVQISDLCPGAGGQIMKSISVKVLPKPPLPVFTSNSPVCTGGQLILSAPPIPGTTYFIENPGAGLGGGQYTSTAVFNNVTAAYSGTWIAIATDANGCTSDTARTIVVINPTLSPTVTITSSATNICTGTLVTFTATAINAGNSPTYQWLVNSKKVGTNSPVYSSNSFVNNDAVSCVVSASGPCAGAFDVSNIIVLTVSPSGTPTFDPIGPLCQNSTPPVLPLTSKEGIAGTWSPASINTSAPGTATYIFTPSSACSTPTSINITIATTITPTFPTVADSYCLNDIAPALPTTSKEGINGTWSPSSINTATVGSTVYTFTPAAGQCGTSLQIAIVVNPLPTLTMGPDVTIAPGASTTLNVSVTGNIVSYQWQPSTGLNNATIEDPVASPSSTTVYTLNIIDDNKCEASDSIRITVSGGGGTSKISVPNAFSPNGDGINDTWVITTLSAFPGATVDVFNRYGQPVFHSENLNKAWDGTYNGKPLPVGTYYYIIDLKNNEKKTAGSVTIFK